MVKKGTFSLTLGEMDHFSVPHAVTRVSGSTAADMDRKFQILLLTINLKWDP